MFVNVSLLIGNSPVNTIVLSVNGPIISFVAFLCEVDFLFVVVFLSFLFLFFLFGVFSFREILFIRESSSISIKSDKELSSSFLFCFPFLLFCFAFCLVIGTCGFKLALLQLEILSLESSSIIFFFLLL